MHGTVADARVGVGGVVAQRRGFVPCVEICVLVVEAVTYVEAGGTDAVIDEGGGGVAEDEKMALNVVFAVVSVESGLFVGSFEGASPTAFGVLG